MKKQFKRTLSVILALLMVLNLGILTAFAAEPKANEAEPETKLVMVDNGLVKQDLDYTEDPVDIPNPDRGFYQANDGMVVPVTGSGSGTMNVGATPVTTAGVTINTMVSHVYFDLRNYSSNAFTSRGTRYNRNYRAPAEVSIKSRKDPVNPATGTWDYRTHFDYWLANEVPNWPKGNSQPITEDGLNYIRDKLQQVRDGKGVAIVRFNYDGPGFSWVDCEHPQDGYIDRLITDQIEPDKDTMLAQIAQLKPILHEYEDIIMSVDGGLFGPWGEMHSTTFGTSAEANAWLLDALLDAVPESRSIAVQGGAFLAWYNNKYGTDYDFSNMHEIEVEPGTPEARFGFFNDSYAYGGDLEEDDDGFTIYADDWGSLAEGAGWPDKDDDEYDRAKVMTWIRNQNNLYGGEAQGDATFWNSYPMVAWEAAYAQTVYLNADYSHEVHSRWADFDYADMEEFTGDDGMEAVIARVCADEDILEVMADSVGYEEDEELAELAAAAPDIFRDCVLGPYEDLGVEVEFTYDPVYEEANGLEYWRDRLGYRLVLRDSNLSGSAAQNGTLEFDGKIQNVGWGNIINKKNVSVVLKSKDGEGAYIALTDIDARAWRPEMGALADNEKALYDVEFSVDLSSFKDFTTGDAAKVPMGEYEVYLKLNDPKETTLNKRSIRFANKGDDVWDADLGANLIGETEITAPEKLTADLSDPEVVAELRATINELYSGTTYDTTDRAHKMQAFIMEIALRAKLQNPDFCIIPQDAAQLAYVDADAQNGAGELLEPLISLVDGWGKEELLQSRNYARNAGVYGTLVDNGIFVSETSTVESAAGLETYYSRAAEYGIVPYPRLDGDLTSSLNDPDSFRYRWAENSDYFWIEPLEDIGREDTANTNDIVKLTDAKNYLYHINGRPFDAWETWDAEEEEYEDGDGDRIRVDDGYACGLLIPCEGGPYQPIADDDELLEELLEEYGTEWDWWWRAAGYTEDQGREVWLETLRNSPYDVIYIDSFYNHRAFPQNQTPLTREEVESLKVKPDGGTRKIIAYLSIGSAEQNRWYCQDDWTFVDGDNENTSRSMKSGRYSRKSGVYTPYVPEDGVSGAPAWLAFSYGGNYDEEAIVQWWNPEWRDIIINGGGKYSGGIMTTDKGYVPGDNTSSIDRIVAQGFDGVYLDNVGVYSNQGWTYFVDYWQAHGGIPGDNTTAELVDSGLDYTEDPVDVTNPDRGFYRAAEYVVPVEEGEEPEVPNLHATITGTSVEVDSSIVYMEFNLCNFSDNAPLDGLPNSPYTDPDDVVTEYGVTQPLTEAALDYIRSALEQVRESGAVAIVKFNYDGDGNTYIDEDEYDGLLHDPEPGAPQGRAWYESVEWETEEEWLDSIENRVETPDDSCGIEGHEDKNWVQYHLWQLSHIYEEYEDCIMAVKGGTFGPWGEMHSSSYARTAEGYDWLLNALLDYVPESRSILVHADGVMAWYNVEKGLTGDDRYNFHNLMPAPEAGTPESRFGMFNDSFSEGIDEGLYNDNGSLSEGWALISDEEEEEDAFDRNNALLWIRQQNNFYGGETVGPRDESNVYPRCPSVLYDAAYTQATHLNTGWNRRTYTLWESFEYTEDAVTTPVVQPHDGVARTAFYDPLYEGKNAMEYIRDRLGYRLVLRDAKASGWVGQEGVLEFEGKIQNVGFGNIINKKNVSVVLKNKADESAYIALTTIDAREWRPEMGSNATNDKATYEVKFAIDLADFVDFETGEAVDAIPYGQYEIYLKLNDPKETTLNQRSIRFANKGTGIWDADLGANLIGETIVIYADTISDDEAIALAKEAIEGGKYACSYNDGKTEALALQTLKGLLGKLSLHGVTLTVNKVKYTAPGSVAGSYVFTVTLEKAMGESVTTKELTMTIRGNGTRPPAAEPTEPTEPTEPMEPTEPTEPTEPVETEPVVVEPTVEVNEDGEAAVTVDEETIADAIAQGAEEGATELVIAPTVEGEADKVSVEIPAGVVDQIGETDMDVTVKTDLGEVTIPNDALAELVGEEGENLSVSVETVKNEDGEATGEVKLEIAVGEATIDKVPGGMTVTIPGGEELDDGNVLVIVGEDGSETIVKKSVVENGAVSAILDGSCTVKIVDNTKEFNDIDIDWAKAAVVFVTSHELFKGVSEDSFAPAMSMNRAMLATVLFRLEDAVAEGTNPFADVEEGTWYTEAAIWANEAGIVTGSDIGFEPNRDITRQEIVVMLHRYAKFVGMDAGVKGENVLDAFGDKDEVAGWAADAMAWAVETGVITGRNGTDLAPTGTAQRAEVAVMLQRFIKLMLA